jgi:hypothetical protein
MRTIEFGRYNTLLHIVDKEGEKIVDEESCEMKDQPHLKAHYTVLRVCGKTKARIDLVERKAGEEWLKDELPVLERERIEAHIVRQIEGGEREASVETLADQYGFSGADRRRDWAATGR